MLALHWTTSIAVAWEERMNRKPRWFQHLAPAQTLALQPALIVTVRPCVSCGRLLPQRELATTGLPGILNGPLCPDCLYMASYHLLHARPMAGQP